MRNSCIQHVPQSRIVMIREDYVSMCKDAPDSNCASAILNEFEYMTNFKIEHSNQAKNHNDILLSGGQEPTQDESLWIYMSTDDLQLRLMGLFGRNKIIDNRKWLVDNGYLSERNNPIYAWDKTKQYLFSVETINKALTELNPASFENKQSTAQDQTIELPPLNEQYHRTQSKNTNKKKKKIKAQTDKSVDVGIHSYIKVWIDMRGSDTLGNPYVNMTYRGYVQHMIDNGISVQDVQDYITELRTQPFWKGKSIGLRYIAEHICAWKAKQPTRPVIPQRPDRDPEPHELATPEQLAEYDREFELTLQALSGVKDKRYD